MKIVTKKTILVHRKTDIGSSQDKSYNKQKIQLLDKNNGKMGMQIIQKHGKRKYMAKKLQKVQKYCNNKKNSYEIFNIKTRNYNECQNLCFCNQKYI